MLHHPVRSAETPQRHTLGQATDQLPPLVRAAIRIIESNVAEPVPVPDIADQLGLSQRQLERQFKQAVGCTVVQFGLLFRLQHARVLLIATKLSVRDIAAAAGFNTCLLSTSRRAVGRILVGAKVQPNRNLTALARRQPRRYRLCALVVEPKSVDRGTILAQPEQPRLGIAGLRSRRRRPDFDKAEPGPAQRRNRRCILVKPRRQPDRIGQGQPRNRRGQPGRGDHPRQWHQPLSLIHI